MTKPVIIGNATLYLGDCREILPTLPKVDAVAQLAAKDARRADIHNEVLAGVEVLAAMHDRARTGKSWNVTADERETLTRTVTVLDRWYRTQPNSRWKRALYQVLLICDRATASGAGAMDVIESPA
jgi:hypothetical protein